MLVDIVVAGYMTETRRAFVEGGRQGADRLHFIHASLSFWKW